MAYVTFTIDRLTAPNPESAAIMRDGLTKRGAAFTEVTGPRGTEFLVSAPVPLLPTETESPQASARRARLPFRSILAPYTQPPLPNPEPHDPTPQVP